MKKETMHLPISLAIIPPRGFEPASDCRKTSKGWGCVEKVVQAKLSIYYKKHSADCDN